MTASHLTVIALVLSEPRLSEWTVRLQAALPANVRLVGCPTEQSLRAANPEVIVGHQEGLLLEYIEQPSPNLRWVHILSAGVDRALDRVRGSVPTFRMTRSSGIHVAAMREYALAVMLHFCKRISEWELSQAKRIWRPSALDLLFGTTLLAIGTGSIGRAIAEAAATLGMNTMGVSLHGYSCSPFSRVEPTERLREVLPLADFIVLAAPLTAQTEKMIDEAAFASMKAGAVLINVARGALIEEPALINALRSGQIAGAALDVFETEPLPSSSLLWTAPNILLTPHVAGRFAEGHDHARSQFLANLNCYMRGEPLAAEVDYILGY